MNEPLQVFTAFGVMVAGDQSAVAPVPCQKEIYRKIDPILLKDENGHLGEHIAIERKDQAPQKYLFKYTIRDTSGAERTHYYQVSAGKDCNKIDVKRSAGY